MRQHRVRISRSGIDRADDGVDHACALSGSASTATSRDMPTYVDHVRMRNDKENKVNMPSCQRGVKRTGSIDGCMPTAYVLFGEIGQASPVVASKRKDGRYRGRRTELTCIYVLLYMYMM